MLFDWNTPAGLMLDRLARAIQAKRIPLAEPLVVFGSAPLQLGIAPGFLSADVDIATIKHLDELQALIRSLQILPD